MNGLAAQLDHRRLEIATVVLAILVYLSSLGFGFVLDDEVEVVNNEHIRSLLNTPKIFMSTGWEGAGHPLPWYRPLTTFTYAVNHAVSGLSPWSYHLVNLLLHAVVSLLVLKLGLLLGLSSLSSAAAALVFAVHPIHVEAVVNIAGRKDLLASMFIIGAVLSHRKGVNLGSARHILLAAFLSVLAMLSKEIGVVTIGLLAITDLQRPEPPKNTRNRLVFSYLLQATALVIYLTIRWRMVGQLSWGAVPYGDNPLAYLDTFGRVATAVVVVGRGLSLLILPVSQMPDYSDATIAPVLDIYDPRLWIVSIILMAGFATAAYRYRRDSLPLYASLWYAITLLPVSNVLLPIGTVFGERLLYLPSVGFCLLVGWAFALLAEVTNRKVTFWVLGLLLGTLSLLTIAYSSHWRSDDELFTYAVEVNPGSSKVQHMVGRALQRQGRDKEAIAAYSRALEINPALGSSAMNLGQLLQQKGRLDEAERLYRSVVAASGSEDARYRLATLYRDAGRTTDAERLWEQILVRNPRHAASLLDLGTYRFMQSDFAAAEELWQAALAVDSTNPTVWYNLGLLYERRNDHRKARFYWLRFMTLAGPELQSQRARVQSKLDSAAP